MDSALDKADASLQKKLQRLTGELFHAKTAVQPAPPPKPVVLVKGPWVKKAPPKVPSRETRTLHRTKSSPGMTTNSGTWVPQVTSKGELLQLYVSKMDSLKAEHEDAKKKLECLQDWLDAPQLFAAADMAATNQWNRDTAELAGKIDRTREKYLEKRAQRSASQKERDAQEEALGIEALAKLQQGLDVATNNLATSLARMEGLKMARVKAAHVLEQGMAKLQADRDRAAEQRLANRAAAESEFKSKEQKILADRNAALERRSQLHAKAENTYARTLSQLQGEQDIAVDEANGGKLAPEAMVKGLLVYAKKRADEPEFLAANIEVKMTTGKLLVVFVESKVRTVVEASLVRKSKPRPLDDVNARFDAARVEAAKCREEAFIQADKETDLAPYDERMADITASRERILDDADKEVSSGSFEHRHSELNARHVEMLRQAEDTFGPEIDLEAAEQEVEKCSEAVAAKVAFLEVKKKKAKERASAASLEEENEDAEWEAKLQARLASERSLIDEEWQRGCQERKRQHDRQQAEWKALLGFSSDTAVSDEKLKLELQVYNQKEAVAAAEMKKLGDKIALLEIQVAADQVEEEERKEEQRKLKASEAVQQKRTSAPPDSVFCVECGKSNLRASAACQFCKAHLEELPVNEVSGPVKQLALQQPPSVSQDPDQDVSCDDCLEVVDIQYGEETSDIWSEDRTGRDLLPSPPPQPATSLHANEENDAGETSDALSEDTEMEEFEKRLNHFEHLLEQAHQVPKGDNLAKSSQVASSSSSSNNQQILLLSQQVEMLKSSIQELKGDCPPLPPKPKRDLAGLRGVTDPVSPRDSLDDYATLTNDELPPLPRDPPPLSNKALYKDYMKLRYEYQRRGLLEEMDRNSGKEEAERKAIELVTRLQAARDAKLEARGKMSRSSESGSKKLGVALSRLSPRRKEGDDQEAKLAPKIPVRSMEPTQSFDHLRNDELPALPDVPPPMTDQVAYKNYMKLRYVYQERGLLSPRESHVEKISPRSSSGGSALPSVTSPRSPRSNPASHVAASVASDDSYEGVPNEALPPLPDAAPAIADRVAYKAYMKLRYEYQSRGLLEENTSSVVGKGSPMPSSKSPRGIASSQKAITALPSQSAPPPYSKSLSNPSLPISAAITKKQPPPMPGAPPPAAPRKTVVDRPESRQRDVEDVDDWLDDLPPNRKPASTSSVPAQQQQPNPSTSKKHMFRVGEYVEAMYQGDEFFYVAKVEQVSGSFVRVFFTEYGCFGMRQETSVESVNRLPKQPVFSLKDEVLVDESVTGSDEPLSGTVDKIGLNANRTECTYHVRVTSTGKTLPCTEIELTTVAASKKTLQDLAPPQADVVARQKRAQTIERMSVMLDALDNEFARFFEDQHI